MTETEVWAGCYDDGWQGLIVPAAFSHPAKAARGLIRRIFNDLALPKGSLVVDPFAGVGTTGIEAASRELRFVGVELEPRFVELARQTFALNAPWWERMGYPMPVIVQGDSRELCRHVAGVDAVSGSPPYAESIHSGNGIDPTKLRGNIAGPHSQAFTEGYGDTPGQLGAMPSGSVDAVVSSPPFGQAQSGGGIKRAMRGEGDYNVTTAMPGSVYGEAEREAGNLESLPLGAVDAMDPNAGRRSNDEEIEAGKIPRIGLRNANDYGNSPGQLSAMAANPATFWEASAVIIEQSYAILRPSGVAVFITKDFVRKGKRVPFTDDWVRLCESRGFVLERRVQASLVKTQRGGHLFDGEHTAQKERKSFFRRLYEQKYPHNAIDWEDVVFLRRAT